MPQLFTNNAVTLLGDAILATDTTIRVLAGTGALFPQPVNPDDFFIVTLENQLATLREILRVTSRVNDVFYVQRAQEGTQALPWGQQTLVDLRETAGTLRRFQQVINDSVTLYFGVDGNLRVGATQQFAPKTAQLWIGGLRQCLGIDYIEESPSVLKVLYPITQADLESGMNVVLDYHKY